MAPRRFLALLAAAALCIVPAACGDDDSSSDGGSADSAETTAVTFKTTETGDGQVQIDGPKTVDAGVVELTLDNSGKGLHDAQVLRVEGDRSADDVISATVDSDEGAPIPEWITDGGGVGTTKPGASSTATQILEPGTYYLLDSESAQGSEKVNARRGGVAKFEVTGETTADAELPATDATITADEYSFVAEGVKPGSNELLFENAGEQLHHIIAFPLAKGATIADAEKLFKSNEEPKGPPPVDFENGVSTAVIDGGQKQVVDLDFKQGKYALVCFITNRDGGPPHAAMGMIEELDVQ